MKRSSQPRSFKTFPRTYIRKHTKMKARLVVTAWRAICTVPLFVSPSGGGEPRRLAIISTEDRGKILEQWNNASLAELYLEAGKNGWIKTAYGITHTGRVYQSSGRGRRVICYRTAQHNLGEVRNRYVEGQDKVEKLRDQQSANKVLRNNLICKVELVIPWRSPAEISNASCSASRLKDLGSIKAWD